MLSGKLALVTGGARGIGLAVAKVLAREGASIVVADLNKEDGIDALKGFTSPSGHDTHMAVELDVTNERMVGGILQEVMAKYKNPPGILVNSAGITRDGYLLKMTDDSFDRVVEVNLKGTYLTNKAVAGLLRERGLPGSIVNISSVVGKLGNKAQTNYSASKAGVIGFTKSAAKELGQFGIRVNCICPGFVETEMTSSIPEHMKQMTIALTPLNRIGQPVEVAEAVAFLASDKASFITGATVDVNGGFY